MLDSPEPHERAEPEARRRRRVHAEQVALVEELEPRVLAVVGSEQALGGAASKPNGLHAELPLLLEVPVLPSLPSARAGEKAHVMAHDARIREDTGRSAGRRVLLYLLGRIVIPQIIATMCRSRTR
jgi:hypothetical protein